MNSRLNQVAILFLLLASCGRDLPRLSGVDTDQWKADRGGCAGYRKTVQDSLQMDLSMLKGLSENDVLQILGKPDQNELYKRNQKFYTYFVTPGPACDKPDSAALRLILRFNAMGYAQLVSIE